MGAFEVTPPSLLIDEKRNLKVDLFDDICDCISSILLIEDKLIYFVVSATAGMSIVPLIHNHRCIERIYVCHDAENEESSDWIQDYSKIHSTPLSIDQIETKIKEDIISISQRPNRWNRSKALLDELFSQSIGASIPAVNHNNFKDELNTLRIVTLYPGARRPFCLSESYSGKIKLEEYDSMQQCIQSIENDLMTTVFLLISMTEVNDIRMIDDIESVAAIYIVADAQSIERMYQMPTYSKVSGIFVPDETLLQQLTTDIYFHVQCLTHSPSMGVFKVESDVRKTKFDQQVDFGLFQLFSTILSELPVKPTTTIAGDTMNSDQLFSRYIGANMAINHIFNQFTASTLEKTIPALKELHQYTERCATKVNSISWFVYRAQLVSRKDLQTIQSNPNSFLSVQAFIVASRSLQSIAEICRRARDSQLTVILFTLKLSETASILSMDSDTVVFKLGTVFRLVSLNMAPDGVYCAGLELADGIMQLFSDKLQLGMGNKLTWLTFGNYLIAIKQATAAKEYYQYLENHVSPDHPNIASMYNNMGLMYSALDNGRRALACFDMALEREAATSSILSEDISAAMETSPSENTHGGKLMVLNKLAERSVQHDDYATALHAYCQALEITEDEQLREVYQKKIDTLSHFH